MVCIHWLLSCIHLFNCSLMQMSNQPIRLQQQFSAFSHLDIIKMICWISNWATLNVAWLLMADTPVCSKAADQLGFSHMSFSRVYRESGLKNRKYPVNGSSLWQNALMRRNSFSWLLTISIPLQLQCTHVLMATSSLITPCYKAPIISNWFLASTVTRSQSSRATVGCGGVGYRGCAASKSAGTVRYYNANMDLNCSLNLWYEELKWFLYRGLCSVFL